jgi:hypothetical protein
MSALRRRTVALAMLALLALGVRPAAAHDQPYSYLDLRIEPGRVRGEIQAHVYDLANAIYVIPPDSLLSPRFAAEHHARLIAALARRLTILADGETLRAAFAATSEPIPDRRRLRFRFVAPLSRPPGRITILGPLILEDPQHQTFVSVYERGALLRQDYLDASRRSVTIYGGGSFGALAAMRTFVGRGIHHILIGPDHILFVVALLLPGGGLGRLLKIVTAFTLAHSLTLALAALGVVQPPARIIEPAIALSIVWVGAQNVFGRAHDRRVWIAFFFGLVHGFGFAGVLRTFGLPREALGWSLAAFNVGVEIAQAAIVVTVTPAIAALARRSPALAERVKIAGSAAVIAAGAYWLVQRLIAGA